MQFTEFDVTKVQGNILRGYTLKMARHFILEVTDKTAARAFLATAAAGGSPKVPAVTTEQRIESAANKPTRTFNLGFTYEGLRALGLAASDLASFPTEFIEGMTKRAPKLGDFGESSPANWPAPYHQPEAVHVIATAYATEEYELDVVRENLRKAFGILTEHDGRSLDEGKVFFGYRDGLSQPKFKGFHPPQPKADQPERFEEPDDPLGTILLDQPTRLPDLAFRVPTPKKLGSLGTFNAFRVLEQDCFAFEDFLKRTADLLMKADVWKDLIGHEHVKNVFPEKKGRDAVCEVIAAQLCGRWRDGTSMQLAHQKVPGSKELPLNEFDYGRNAICPMGSHVRRNNPRGGEIVQRIANFTRRLVRRGMSYGPDFDPESPDKLERGLLGNFIGASLGAQFEAVMCDWLNMGLNSPDISGSNDPLIGANSPETSWFDLNIWTDRAKGIMGKHRIYGLPRFVTTRGGAYTFLPSIDGIAYLGGLQD